MAWNNGLRLILSLLLSTLLIFALVVVFNQRQHTIASTSATIIAPRAAVASNYGGTVVASFVRIGQSVEVGDPLFEVSSVSLQQDLARGTSIVTSEALEIDHEAGTLRYLATIPGTVTEVTAQAGGYLPATQPLAVITGNAGRVVEAQYVLTPVQYGQVEKGAPVTLRMPDDTRVEGVVESALVRTVDAKAVVTVRIASDGLNSGDLALIATDGAPVRATVQLRDDGPLAGPTDAVRALIHKVGL